MMRAPDVYRHTLDAITVLAYMAADGTDVGDAAQARRMDAAAHIVDLLPVLDWAASEQSTGHSRSGFHPTNHYAKF